MITGIVIALSEELGTLTATKIGTGKLARINDKLWIANAGAGAENAKIAAERLHGHGATRLISWGCAAGLINELKPGDLVLAERCIAADGTVLETHKQWLEHACALLDDCSQIRRGIAESNGVIASAAEKQQLAMKFNAAALDMESAAVAKVANRKGLPFLSVRAIADPCDMDLPEAVVTAVDASGQVDLLKLVFHLLKHPYQLPALIRLGLHFRAAKDTLTRAGKMLDKLIDIPLEAA